MYFLIKYIYIYINILLNIMKFRENFSDIINKKKFDGELMYNKKYLKAEKKST